MPDFLYIAKARKTTKRVMRYEFLGADNRVTFAVRKTGSIHATFHNAAVALSSPPNTYHPLTHKHTYCTNK